MARTAEKGVLFEHTGAVAYTKNTGVFSKIKKSVFLPVLSCKPNSFRGPGGLCWRIGVTAALLGRLLPSDGHKLVKKKNGNSGPKVPQIVHFLTGRFFLNLYGEQSILRKRTVLLSTLATPGDAKDGNWARTDPIYNILHLGSEELCGIGDTGGFLKIARSKKKILVQIFGPKIQAQN
jgi:hypothetical protein